MSEVKITLQSTYCKKLNSTGNKTRKTQLTQRGTRDSDACVKARCERNLSSQRCFI